jgi:hypothetical protein
MCYMTDYVLQPNFFPLSINVREGARLVLVTPQRDCTTLSISTPSIDKRMQFSRFEESNSLNFD